MYTRKTRDEYQIWTNYGYGWEEETCEETRKDARAQVKCYRENATGLQGIKIVKKRIKIEDENA